MTPPALRPYSALMLLVTTLNSATASGEGCITWFEKPWLLVPYALLSMPSSRKLLKVLRRPLMLNEPSRTVGDEPVFSGGEPDARAEQRQRRVFAAVERQLHDLLAGDDLAALARVGLEPRRRPDDLDRLGQVAWRQLQFDALPGANGDLHIVGERGREALRAQRQPCSGRCGR